MPGPGFHEILRYQARRDRDGENSARLAVAWATYQAAGSGALIEPKPFVFQTVFLYEPIFSSGAVFDDASSAIITGVVPRCSAVQYDWVRDASGFYTGAHVAFAIDDGDPTYLINFHLLWTGIAYKDVLKNVAPGILYSPPVTP